MSNVIAAVFAVTLWVFWIVVAFLVVTFGAGIVSHLAWWLFTHGWNLIG